MSKQIGVESPGQADATELRNKITITPGMKEAGAFVLGELRDVLASEELAAAVYTAMAVERPAKGLASQRRS